jgi:hypothetical protein
MIASKISVKCRKHHRHTCARLKKSFCMPKNHCNILILLTHKNERSCNILKQPLEDHGGIAMCRFEFDNHESAMKEICQIQIAWTTNIFSRSDIVWEDRRWYRGLPWSPWWAAEESTLEEVNGITWWSNKKYERWANNGDWCNGWSCGIIVWTSSNRGGRHTKGDKASHVCVRVNLLWCVEDQCRLYIALNVNVYTRSISMNKA